MHVSMYLGTAQGFGAGRGRVGQGHGSPAGDLGDLETWRLRMRLLRRALALGR